MLKICLKICLTDIHVLINGQAALPWLYLLTLGQKAEKR